MDAKSLCTMQLKRIFKNSFFCGVAITFIIFSEEIITYKCLSGLLHVIENLQSRGISESSSQILESQFKY